MTKKQKLYEDLIRKINEGYYRLDDALPSIRNASILFGVSKNTVLEAYDKLKNDGIIHSIPGSKHYVTARSYNKHYKNLSSHFVSAVDTIELLQEQLLQSYSLRPGDGRYPRKWMQQLQLEQYLGDISDSPSGILNATEYGQPQGLPELLDILSYRLNTKGITTQKSQCLMTSGANQALDLIIRHFLDAGDHVIIESPGYYPLFSKLSFHKVRKHSIERHSWGYDLDKLSSLCQTWKPKIFFLQPSVHNPTGTTLSLEHRQSIIEIAKRYNMLLVEEDPFSDLYPSLPPSLSEITQGQGVIYIGTFSKTMTASLRCGYIAASPQIINSLLTLKIVTLVNTSAILETIVYDIISSGRYECHLKTLSLYLDNCRDKALALFKELPFSRITGKNHGFYLWCTLPSGTDDLRLSEKAKNYDIFLAPGRLFMNDELPYTAFRMNIAYSQDEKLFMFLKSHLL